MGGKGRPGGKWEGRREGERREGSGEGGKGGGGGRGVEGGRERKDREVGGKGEGRREKGKEANVACNITFHAHTITIVLFTVQFTSLVLQEAALIHNVPCACHS